MLDVLISYPKIRQKMEISAEYATQVWRKNQTNIQLKTAVIFQDD